MEFIVKRQHSTADATIGGLYKVEPDGVHTLLCYTLEDEKRAEKVWGETRIPQGRYRLTLRQAGKHHERYRKQFPDMHKGTIWVREVPGFEWIMHHTGVNDDHTAGCLLYGEVADMIKMTLARSTDAYKRVYPIIRDAILAEPTFCTYWDADNSKPVDS